MWPCLWRLPFLVDCVGKALGATWLRRPQGAIKIPHFVSLPQKGLPLRGLIWWSVACDPHVFFHHHSALRKNLPAAAPDCKWQIFSRVTHLQYPGHLNLSCYQQLLCKYSKPSTLLAVLPLTFCATCVLDAYGSQSYKCYCAACFASTEEPDIPEFSPPGLSGLCGLQECILACPYCFPHNSNCVAASPHHFSVWSCHLGYSLHFECSPRSWFLFYGTRAS